ncbi:MAG: serine/threonine-protein phosphatase [Bacteroidaceae bacterium]|nr:serine/threonine-protein phosphatase [Bacteroidaceae bacterium]
MELITLHRNDEDQFTAFGESRIGGRKDNQDTFGAQHTEFGFVVTVCDGMGGGPGGKTASSIAVHEIIASISEAGIQEESKNILIKAIRRANMAIITAGNEQPSLRGMGTTATVLLLTDRAAYVAHVGDTRVYQVRGHRKVFRTSDHSMVFDLVRQGVITEEQARLSAQSNVITRALGMKPDVEVDIAELPYQRGDRFLLSTDGVHGTMPEPELVRMVANHKTALGAVVDDIATTIDNNGRENGGGHDNLTLAIVETKKNSKLQPKMTQFTKYLLLTLLLLCTFSIAANMYQYRSKKTPEDFLVEMDSLQHRESVLQDSVRHLNDSLEKVSGQLKAIGDLIQGTTKK